MRRLDSFRHEVGADDRGQDQNVVAGTQSPVCPSVPANLHALDPTREPGALEMVDMHVAPGFDRIGGNADSLAVLDHVLALRDG